MSLRIKENDKPPLSVCKMVCDGGLHEKLNKYDLTKFMNAHETNLLIGRPGSGKTSLLYSLFKSPKLFRKVFHNIFLFQPNQSRASMQDNIFERIPDNQKYDELTCENLEEVMDTIKSEDPKYMNCIIFDDMGAYLRSDARVLQLLRELIFNRRHVRCSIFFLVQNWKSCHPDIRKLFSNIFVFRVSKSELHSIFDEIVESKKRYVDDIAKLVFREPYRYLFINVNSQRIFDGFDEILTPDDSEIEA